MSSNGNIYRLNWKNSSTNMSGIGQHTISKVEADGWIKYLHKKYPHLDHWITVESNTNSRL